MRIILCSITLLLIGTLSGLNAQEATSSLVTTDMPVGARSVGMGGAYTAVAADGSAFAWNSGGVSLNKNVIVSGMYGSHHGAIGTALANVLHCGAVIPLHDNLSDMVFSVDWLRFQATDQRLNPDLSGLNGLNEHEAAVKAAGTAQFAPQAQDAWCLSMARDNILTIDFGWSQYQLPIEFPIGLTARYLRATANGNSADGIAVDAGIMMRMNLKDMFFSDDYPRLSFSWALKNIGGTTLSWNTGHSDYFAYHYAVGIALTQPFPSLYGDMLLSYDYHSRDEGSSRIGAEWLFSKTYSLRLGIFDGALCCGAGVDLRFLVLDYAYQFSTQAMLGDIHRLNCSFRMEHIFR